MPAAIIIFIRGAIQLAITSGAASAGMWLLDRAIERIAKTFGATEQQAIDIAANSWIQTTEFIGIGALAMQSRIPSKLADRLGFTTKGYKPRPSILGEKPIKTLPSKTPTLSAAETTAAIETTAATIASQKSTTIQKVSAAAQLIIAGLGVPVGFGLLITNTLDFAAWSSSAYQDTFQKVLSFFGLEPDKTYVKAQVLSEDMSKKILGVYTQKGATGIKDPRTDIVLPFNRENFIKIADFIAAEIIYEKGEVKTKQVLGVMNALVVLGKTGEAGSKITSASFLSNTGGISNTKVFTGIVSQGKLGSALSFIARPDDIIESASELQDAAQNNLASYLAALPGRVIYEIKVVPLVTSRDGFVQRGQSRQVVSSYDLMGNPRYKTLVNKFAILNLYILTDKGAKSKLTTIVLGPTDAVKFTPTLDTLAALEKSIQGAVFTRDLAVAIPPPTAELLPLGLAPIGAGAGATAPAPEVPGADAAPNWTGSSSKGNLLTQNFTYNGKGYSFTMDTLAEVRNAPNRAAVIAELQPRYPGQALEISFIDTKIMERVMEQKWREAVSGGAIVKPKPGADAQTLSEWYAANGRSLPSVAERSQIYEHAGLGAAGLYVGTAEQNTRLLNALKSGTV